MTIHRAKGLEFDHVLVPGLDRSVGAGERPLLRWIDLPRERGASDLIVAPAAAIGEEGGGELNVFLAGLLTTRARHERTRLMYVAATRARETLHLSGAPKMKSGARFDPDPRSLLACLWPALAERFQAQAAASLVITALARTLGDERGRWMLGAGHAEEHSELALTGLTAGRLRSVVIDRCFVDEAGTRWVIDYKTSRHEGGSLESFLEQEMQRYQGQLSGYLTLARALGPQPVRAALYFPLLGAFRELSRGRAP